MGGQLLYRPRLGLGWPLWVDVVVHGVRAALDDLDDLDDLAQSALAPAT